MSVEDLFLNSKKKIPMVTNSSHPKRNSCRGIIKHLNSTSRNSWGLGTHLWDIGVKPFIAMVPKLGGVRVTLLDSPGWKLIHGPLVKGDEPILGFCIIFKWKDVSFRGGVLLFFPILSLKPFMGFQKRRKFAPDGRIQQKSSRKWRPRSILRSRSKLISFVTCFAA